MFKTYGVVKYAFFLVSGSIVVGSFDEDFKSAVLVFKLCVVDKYAPFLFSRSVVVNFSEKALKSALLMFMTYVVEKCALVLLFNATSDLLDETINSEDVLLNRGTVENTVVVVIDVVGGGGPHLTLNFPSLLPINYNPSVFVVL